MLSLSQMVQGATMVIRRKRVHIICLNCDSSNIWAIDKTLFFPGDKWKSCRTCRFFYTCPKDTVISTPSTAVLVAALAVSFASRNYHWHSLDYSSTCWPQQCPRYAKSIEVCSGRTHRQRQKVTSNVNLCAVLVSFGKNSEDSNMEWARHVTLSTFNSCLGRWKSGPCLLDSREAKLRFLHY